MSDHFRYIHGAADSVRPSHCDDLIKSISSTMAQAFCEHCKIMDILCESDATTDYILKVYEIFSTFRTNLRTFDSIVLL